MPATINPLHNITKMSTSKSKLKSLLKSKSKDEIIDLVMKLYSARKEAREYLDYYAEPDENAKLEEYKSIIEEEFFPSRGITPKLRFSVCRKAVADFKKLNPSPEALAELMMSYMENACEFADTFGDTWEQYYTSVEGNFERTLRYIADCGLWDKYDSRIRKCLDWASTSGWGFPETLNEIYEEILSRH